QRRGDHARILPILEWVRGRSEVDVADVLGLVARQAVARCLDRHGDRVFVPVGHRALALGEAAQPGGEPLVGVVHRLTAEAQTRHIGPIGHDSDHARLPPDYKRSFTKSLARQPGRGKRYYRYSELSAGLRNHRRQLAEEIAIAGIRRDVQEALAVALLDPRLDRDDLALARLRQGLGDGLGFRQQFEVLGRGMHQGAPAGLRLVDRRLWIDPDRLD